MKENDIDHRPILGDGTPTVDGLSLPETNGRERNEAHDPTNAWGERVVEGEGAYPGPEALEDESPADPASHGGEYHNGAWPNQER